MKGEQKSPERLTASTQLSRLHCNEPRGKPEPTGGISAPEMMPPHQPVILSEVSVEQSCP